MVDPADGRIRYGEKTDNVRPLAMKVLVYLAERAPGLVPIDELIRNVWAPRVVGDDAVAVIISVLRKKLQDDTRNPVYIETVPKRGYRIVAEVDRVSESAHQKAKNSSRSLHRRRSYAVGGIALFLAAVGLYAVSLPESPTSLTATVSVLPLETSGQDQELVVFAEDVKRDLLHELCADVVARGR